MSGAGASSDGVSGPRRRRPHNRRQGEFMGRIAIWLGAATLGLALGAGAQEAPPEAPPAETRAAPATIPVDEPPAEAPPAEGTVLDEITVTAQKRVQSLQETPISIEVFNTERLELRGIEGLNELAGQVPNMTVELFPTHNATLRIFIRGVGPTDAQLTQDPAVGVYVDGVYIARAVGLALDIADLERIEVLRGPQGTLYGRNTTGGAVNLITKRPSAGPFAMTHKLTLGSRSQIFGKSSFNVPVTGDLAVKLAVLGHTRDGYVENLGPGGDFGDRQESAVRFDARWLGEWATLDYTYDRSDLEYYNYSYQAVSTPETNKGQAELFKRYGQSQTLYSSERLEALTTSAPFERSGSKIDGHALTLQMPVGAYELKYIGAYRDLTDAEYQDLGPHSGSPTYRLDSNVYDGPAADVANGGPTPLVVPTVTQTQWTHELQLGGKVLDESVQFLAGLFYFTEEAVEDRHRLNHQLSTGIDPNMANQVGVDITAPGFEQARLVNFVDFWWSIENTALAAFGEATWTPSWLDGRSHWTLGYRHSEDQRDAVKFRISDTYVEAYVNGQGTARRLSSGEFFNYVPASRTFKDDSVSYGASFDLTPAVNLYAKSVEAYKSGGYNVRDPNVSRATADPAYGVGFVEGFNPEHIRSYELGAKTEWLDRRLRLNADVFYSDYRDVQVNFLIPGTVSDTKVRNAGKAEMHGVELDATWLAAPGLLFTVSGAYLETEVKEVIDQNGNNVAHLFPFYSAPPYTGVAALDWAFWDLGFGELRAYLAYNYVGERGGIVIAEERRGLTRLPAYGLLSGRLMLQGFSFESLGALDFALWGRNLAGKDYVISAIDNVPQADRSVIWGEPRTVGLDVIYRFN
jgi:iron complex outermembrane receptor protein